MNHKVTTALLALALASFTFRAGAQDKEPAVNPTGTWRLTTMSAKGQPGPPQTLKLKLEAGKLTGTLSRVNGGQTEQYPLDDGKLKGVEIAFTTHTFAASYVNNVRQPTNTNKVTHAKYQGQISGDTIKGRVERQSYVGNSSTLDWEAKRLR